MKILSIQTSSIICDLYGLAYIIGSSLVLWTDLCVILLDYLYDINVLL